MACDLSVRVIPRASKSAVAGTRGGAVLIRVAAPPVEGAANAALVDLLASTLDLPRRAVTITSGVTSRTKRVHLEDIDCRTALAKLGLSADDADAADATSR